MSKKDEALKLALEAMTYADACLKKQLTTKDKHQYAQDLLLEAGTAIREALAEQPAQRTWVGLTFAEICECENDYLHIFARAIEAKLKEKNT